MNPKIAGYAASAPIVDEVPPQDFVRERLGVWADPAMYVVCGLSRDIERWRRAHGHDRDQIIRACSPYALRGVTGPLKVVILEASWAQVAHATRQTIWQDLAIAGETGGVQSTTRESEW